MSEIVAVAIRCSTDQQEDSPEVQRSIVERFCAANNYVVPPELWFVDFGVSAGLPVAKRPSSNRMLNMVMDRKHRSFTKIVIVRLDRFFRDSKEQAVTWDLITKHGCELVGAKQDLSNDTAIKRAMLTMTGAVNQLEREATGERIKEHNVWRHQNNLNPAGFPPYGLKIGEKSNDSFRIVDFELSRVIRVFEAFADTCGNFTATAKQLNREAVPTREGKRWVASAVKWTVTRPAYRRMGFYDGELRPKPDLIPLTIPADLLDRVDAILTARYGHWHVIRGSLTHSRGNGSYTGLVSCAKCGHPMDLNITPTSAYFRCRDKKAGRCDALELHAPTIDRLVGECLLRTLREWSDAREPKRRTRKPTRIDAAERIRDLEESRSIAVDLVMMGRKGGGIDMDEFRARAAKIDAEIEALSGILNVSEEEATVSPEEARTLAAAWESAWAVGIKSPAKRELLTTLFGVGRLGITIGKEMKPTRRRPTTAIWTVEITGAKVDTRHKWTGCVQRGAEWGNVCI